MSKSIHAKKLIDKIVVPKINKLLSDYGLDDKITDVVVNEESTSTISTIKVMFYFDGDLSSLHLTWVTHLILNVVDYVFVETFTLKVYYEEVGDEYNDEDLFSERMFEYISSGQRVSDGLCYSKIEEKLKTISIKK